MTEQNQQAINTSDANTHADDNQNAILEAFKMGMTAAQATMSAPSPAPEPKPLYPIVSDSGTQFSPKEPKTNIPSFF